MVVVVFYLRVNRKGELNGEMFVVVVVRRGGVTGCLWWGIVVGGGGVFGVGRWQPGRCGKKCGCSVFRLGNHMGDCFILYRALLALIARVVFSLFCFPF